MLGDNYLDNDQYSPPSGQTGYIGNGQSTPPPVSHPVLDYLQGLMNQRQAPSQPAPQSAPPPATAGLMFPWQQDAPAKNNGIMSGMGKSALGNL